MLAPSPSPRLGHGAFWDGARVLVFAGESAYSMSAGLSDTWGWNGVAWSEVAPAQVPEWRTDSAMAWASTSASG